MNKLTALAPALCCLFIHAGAVAGQTARPDASMPSATVPFVIKEIDGHRPVVAVTVNATPFHMVVHSNAGFFMQIHHALAARTGVKDVRHVGAFGIQGKGQLSPLGRDEGRLDRVTIGKAVFRDVPVSVFETPGDQDSGMLGLDWIRANRIVIDFAANTVTMNPTAKAAADVRRRLLQRGYVAVPIQRDADTKRYHVDVTIGGATKKMDVSTVAETNIDTEFARDGGIGLGAVKGIYGGPQGSTGRVYAVASPVTIALGTWRSHPTERAIVEDVYAYASKERPKTGAIGGQLGADFMIDNAAIIDFGNQTLYLRGR